MRLARLALFCLLATVSTAHAKLKVGDSFPEVRLKHLKSTKVFQTSSLRGKVTLIDFWGSDCPPCRLAIPELNALYLKLRSRDFTLIGINVDQLPEDTDRFLEDYKVDYPLLDDRRHDLVKTMGVRTMPTSYLLDRTGRVRYIHSGFKSGDAALLERKIEELLAAPAPASVEKAKRAKGVSSP